MALGLRIAAGLLAMVTLGGCTYAEREPGLFATHDPSAPASTPEPRRFPPRPTNPDLPVAGERIWTTSDGNDVTVRLAVHAVRRTDTLTVLDWSVTPLSAPGTSVGDNAPRSIDLGLTGATNNTVGIVLLDGAGQAYRPVTHRSRRLFNPCLCTPMWLAQQSLRIGETALLQAAYPPLPAEIASVDVAFATVAPIFAVPVTPVGSAPTPTAPTNLARPADPHRRTVPVEVRDQRERVARVSVDSVLTRGDVTAVTWTIEQSQNWGRPFGTTPPLVGAGHASEAFLVNASPADGLGLRAGSTRLQPTWMTARIAAEPAYECLCTEIGLWARTVGKVGGRVQVMTLYPGLPRGAERVRVSVPGVAEPLSVRVEPGVVPGDRLGAPQPARTDQWTLRDGQPARPWSTSDWPTPLPYEERPEEFDHWVETVGPLPAR